MGGFHSVLDGLKGQQSVVWSEGVLQRAPVELLQSLVCSTSPEGQPAPHPVCTHPENNTCAENCAATLEAKTPSKIPTIVFRTAILGETLEMTTILGSSAMVRPKPYG